MPYKNREKQLQYMRNYQKELKQKAKKVELIAELKQLANQPLTSQHLTVTTVELIEKIKEL